MICSHSGISVAFQKQGVVDAVRNNSLNPECVNHQSNNSGQ